MQIQTVENRNNKRKKLYSKYFFGEKSKFTNWMLNHPFQIATGCTLVACLIVLGEKMMLIRTLLVFPVFSFGLALLFRILCKNLCYRVEIDTLSENVTLFRCFNNGIVEAPIKSVAFCFDKHFAAIYGSERFTIFNEYMPGIKQLISPTNDIKFSGNFYARFMKRKLEKTFFDKGIDGDK